MEPAEFKKIVEDIRKVEKALRKVDYSRTEKKKQNRKFARSLFGVEDIPEGAELTEENVRSIRPDDGMQPKHLPEVLGRTASRDLKRGEPLEWGMVRKIMRSIEKQVKLTDELIQRLHTNLFESENLDIAWFIILQVLSLDRLENIMI